MKYKNVLVPLDCSRLAESVLPYAVSISDKFGLDILLCHICSPENCQSVDVHRDYIKRKVEVIKQKLSQRGLVEDNRFHGRIAEVLGISGVGYPAEEIIRYGNENDVSLILISRHGQSGIRQWVIGSTADKIIRASSAPVCLIQVPFTEKNVDLQRSVGTLLVLLDGSKEAESILPHVEALARQQFDESLKVILFTVFDPKATTSFANHNGAIDYLAGIGKRFNGANLNVSCVIRKGKPAPEIIAFVNSELTPFDHIAMTTTSESSPIGHGLGSVAEKVISGVSTPILMVRPDGIDQHMTVNMAH